MLYQNRIQLNYIHNVTKQTLYVFFAKGHKEKTNECLRLICKLSNMNVVKNNILFWFPKVTACTSTNYKLFTKLEHNQNKLQMILECDQPKVEKVYNTKIKL